MAYSGHSIHLYVVGRFFLHAKWMSVRNRPWKTLFPEKPETPAYHIEVNRVSGIGHGKRFVRKNPRLLVLFSVYSGLCTRTMIYTACPTYVVTIFINFFFTTKTKHFTWRNIFNWITGSLYHLFHAAWSRIEECVEYHRVQTFPSTLVKERRGMKKMWRAGGNKNWRVTVTTWVGHPVYHKLAGEFFKRSLRASIRIWFSWNSLKWWLRWPQSNNSRLWTPRRAGHWIKLRKMSPAQCASSNIQGARLRLSQVTLQFLFPSARLFLKQRKFKKFQTWKKINKFMFLNAKN